MAVCKSFVFLQRFSCADAAWSRSEVEAEVGRVDYWTEIKQNLSDSN